MVDQLHVLRYRPKIHFCNYQELKTVKKAFIQQQFDFLRLIFINQQYHARFCNIKILVVLRINYSVNLELTRDHAALFSKWPEPNADLWLKLIS